VFGDAGLTALTNSYQLEGIVTFKKDWVQDRIRTGVNLVASQVCYQVMKPIWVELEKGVSGKLKQNIHGNFTALHKVQTNIYWIKQFTHLAEGKKRNLSSASDLVACHERTRHRNAASRP